MRDIENIIWQEHFYKIFLKREYLKFASLILSFCVEHIIYVLKTIQHLNISLFAFRRAYDTIDDSYYMIDDYKPRAFMSRSTMIKLSRRKPRSCDRMKGPAEYLAKGSLYETGLISPRSEQIRRYIATCREFLTNLSYTIV